MKHLILILVLATAALHASAADKATIILDWFLNPNHTALIIAQERGYFAANGLDITLEEPSDPSLPPKLVAAGKADYAVSYQPQLYLHHQEGLPLIRTATLIATPLNSLIVRADSDIRRIADLKGKKIGYSVAGVDEAILHGLLANDGLAPADIELVNVNWNLNPALISGQVDATIGGMRNFELTQMTLDGHPGRAYFLEEHGIPAYDELILVTNREQYDADRSARLNRALESATQYTLNHPDEAWQSIIKAKPDLDDELNRRAYRDTLRRLALRPGALDNARYRRFAAFLKEHGIIREAPEPAAIAVEPMTP